MISNDVLTHLYRTIARTVDTPLCRLTALYAISPNLHIIIINSQGFIITKLRFQKANLKKKCCVKCHCRCQSRIRASFQFKQLPLHFNSTQSAVHFNFHVNFTKTSTDEGNEESKLCTTWHLMRNSWEHLLCHSGAGTILTPVRKENVN